MSQGRLEGQTIGIILGPEFEDLELWGPALRLREEGAKVLILGMTRDTINGKHGLPTVPDALTSEVQSSELDGLVVPGGWAPDKLRRDPGVLRLVRECNAQGKIIGLICHAGWVAISAGIVKGKHGVGSRGIKEDLENAGGIWRDEAAFREGNLVWGRVVEDVPAFCRELVNALEK